MIYETKQERLFNSLIDYLNQAVNEVCRLREFDYVRKVNGNSSIGNHLRHCYEFIELFTKNVELGKINYDKRKRDSEFENNPLDARFKIEGLIRNIESIKSRKIQPYIFVAESNSINRDGETEYISSTLERELLFLISHTVHHFGIIKLLAQMNNFDLSNNFGKATSTIIYEESKQAA